VEWPALVHAPGKKEAAGAPTPAAKLSNFTHTGGLNRHGYEADNCCSPLHENTNLRTVFNECDSRVRAAFKISPIFCRINGGGPGGVTV
jgi:hypothetical protein